MPEKINTKGNDKIKEKVAQFILFFCEHTHTSKLFTERFTFCVQNKIELIDKYFFPEASRQNPSEENFFLVARRYNSYTPAMPKHAKIERKGGGYILSWEGKIIGIDPGYDFIENIYSSQGIRIKDINAIILTHLHQDHVSDFENLLMLLYELNDKIKERNKKNNEQTEPHKIDIFMNVSTADRFLGLIKNNEYVNDVKILTRGTTLKLDKNIKMKAVRAEHQDISTDKSAIGLYFELCSDSQRKSFRLGLTSDTKWYEGIENEYKDVDLLIAHIGGIRKKELDLEIYNQPARDMFYEKHLGILGAYCLLSEVKAQAVVLQEFGEELVCTVLPSEDIPDNRILLASTLEQLVNNKNQKIIPGEIGLKIKIPQLEISCSGGCGRIIKFQDVKTITLSRPNPDTYHPIMYLCDECFRRFYPTLTHDTS